MKDKRRSGRMNFVTVSFYNPLGIYPTRLYPLFARSDDRQTLRQVYIEAVDDDGYVTDYILIGSSNNSNLALMGTHPLINAVGMPALEALAWAPDRIEIFRGREAFLDGIREKLCANRRDFRKNPAAGVSLAKMISSDNMEALYAGLMTRRIAGVSLTIAQAWMKQADLSWVARGRALKIYRSIKEAKSQEEAQDIRTITFGSASLIQGDYLFTTHEGRLAVRLGNKVYVGWPVSLNSPYRTAGPTAWA